MKSVNETKGARIWTAPKLSRIDVRNAQMSGTGVSTDGLGGNHAS